MCSFPGDGWFCVSLTSVLEGPLAFIWLFDKYADTGPKIGEWALLAQVMEESVAESL